MVASPMLLTTCPAVPEVSVQEKLERCIFGRRLSSLPEELHEFYSRQKGILFETGAKPRFWEMGGIRAFMQLHKLH